MNERDKIRRLIKEKGLIQAHVARQAGMTPQCLNDILSGRRILRVEQLEPIAKALGVKNTDLV